MIQLGNNGLETVFLRTVSDRHYYMNFRPDQNNMTGQIYPVEGTLNQFQIQLMQLEKSMTVNERGEVPLLDPEQFKVIGKNSTIYICFDAVFQEQESFYRAKEVVDALGDVGGVFSLVQSIQAPLFPILCLMFMR